MQVLLVEAPVVAEYFPAPQLVQTELEVAARVVEYLPAVQLMQVPVDVNSLYFPATHAQQVLCEPDPSQSSCPAAHETCAVATCAREHSRRQASARPAIMRGASNIRKGSRTRFIDRSNTRLLGRVEEGGVVWLVGTVDELGGAELREPAELLSLLARLRAQPLVLRPPAPPRHRVVYNPVFDLVEAAVQPLAEAGAGGRLQPADGRIDKHAVP